MFACNLSRNYELWKFERKKKLKHNIHSHCKSEFRFLNAEKYSSKQSSIWINKMCANCLEKKTKSCVVVRNTSKPENSLVLEIIEWFFYCCVFALLSTWTVNLYCVISFLICLPRDSSEWFDSSNIGRYFVSIRIVRKL